MSKNHYKHIVCYETALQKSLIDKAFQLGLLGEDTLLINCCDHLVRIDQEVYDVNFNQVKKTIRSLKNLYKIRRLGLSADYYVGTLFTGINALFLASLFGSGKLILIDDGIGTPVQLLGNYFLGRMPRYRVKKWITASGLFLLHGIRLRSFHYLKSRITAYFSIYKGLELIEPTYYLPIFEKPLVVSEDLVGFIGAPMVEFGLMTKDEYKKVLSNAFRQFGHITYFVHPDESLIHEYTSDEFTVLKPEGKLEHYLEFKAVPKVLISFGSSAMLNVASHFYPQRPVRNLYIKTKIYGPKYDIYYHDFMQKYGIEELKQSS